MNTADKYPFLHVNVDAIAKGLLDMLDVEDAWRFNEYGLIPESIHRHVLNGLTEKFKSEFGDLTSWPKCTILMPRSEEVDRLATSVGGKYAMFDVDFDEIIKGFVRDIFVSVYRQANDMRV